MTARVPEKVVLVVGGREVEARFSTNGLCAVEEAFDGRSLEAIGQDMEAGRASFRAIRAVFRSVLVASIPDLTDVQAGRILEDVGTEEAARVIQGAFGNLQAGAFAKAVDLPELDQRGRLAFDVGGERYVLAFHFNAMAELEPLFPGMTMNMIAAELLAGGVSLVRMRGLFRAALIDDRELSLFEAGELIDRLGLATVSNAVGKAFVGAFPKVPENEGDQGADGAPGNRQQRRAAAAKGDGNPTKPRRRKAGTGTAS